MTRQPGQWSSQYLTIAPSVFARFAIAPNLSAKALAFRRQSCCSGICFLRCAIFGPPSLFAPMLRQHGGQPVDFASLAESDLE